MLIEVNLQKFLSSATPDMYTCHDSASPPDVQNLAKWGTSNFTPLIKLSPGQDHPSGGVFTVSST